MEHFKTIFLLGVVLGAICSGIHSMATLASIKPIQSTEFPAIQFVDTHEAEYDITE